MHKNDFILYNSPDINECLTSNGGCDQVCTNTSGSYYCTCNTGFELDADDHTCNGQLQQSLFGSLYIIIVDINECDTENGGCNHNCTNNAGSFVCSCQSGYQLSPLNNKMCTGMYCTIKSGYFDTYIYPCRY